MSSKLAGVGPSFDLTCFCCSSWREFARLCGMQTEDLRWAVPPGPQHWLAHRLLQVWSTPAHHGQHVNTHVTSSRVFKRAAMEGMNDDRGALVSFVPEKYWNMFLTECGQHRLLLLPVFTPSSLFKLSPVSWPFYSTGNTISCSATFFSFLWGKSALTGSFLPSRGSLLLAVRGDWWFFSGCSCLWVELRLKTIILKQFAAF